MVPRILYLHPKTYKRLIRLRSLPSCQAIASRGAELGRTYQR
jgi:hypothetical protein